MGLVHSLPHRLCSQPEQALLPPLPQQLPLNAISRFA
jgi:hypothetical protein